MLPLFAFSFAKYALAFSPYGMEVRLKNILFHFWNGEFMIYICMFEIYSVQLRAKFKNPYLCGKQGYTEHCSRICFDF